MRRWPADGCARAFARASRRLKSNENRAALHHGGRVSLRVYRVPDDEERDPQSRRVRGVLARRDRGAGPVEPGRFRRARPEIFPQGGRARAAEEGGRERDSLIPVAVGRRRRGARRAAEGSAPDLGNLRQAGLRPPRRRLDLLGLEGRLFRQRGRRAGLLGRAALHARHADGGAELAAMVQHRPALGLWHRWAEPGAFLRRLRQRQDGEVEVLL